MKKATVLLVLIFLLMGTYVHAQEQITNHYWEIGYNNGGVNQMINAQDETEANILSGNLDTEVQFQLNKGEWQSVFGYTRDYGAGENSVRYIDYQPGMPFGLKQEFTLNGEVLEWDITLENKMNYNVKIGDLAINIPWNSPGGSKKEIFEQSFTKHHFISGDGSFIVFTKPSGNPPFMLMTVKPGTKLEYFTSEGSSSYTAYIHSGYSGNAQAEGTWRQPHTYAKLTPAGTPRDKLTYGFQFQWAESYDELRQLLYENKLIDMHVVPGMTLPQELEAQFSLHTKVQIDSVTAEFPDETMLEYIGEEKNDHHLYRVRFDRLGENKLMIHFGDNRKTYLEFFSTQSIHTLLKKRNSFIINKQQHRKPDKWYDGLFSIYDMKNSLLRGPENTDGYEGWWGYVLASDDPALGFAPYLASVNVIFPNQKQIEAIEYYLENFVWGGLQRTDQEEPYPYGIHGVPNWKVARDTMKRAKIENRRLNIMKIWRTYDYPHMFMLYYHMYQIADRYPQMVNYLDADGYLERMWQTVRAFSEYPYEIYPWYEIYKWGNYNEMLIPDIINLLEEKGRQDDADWLRSEWEKKVKYFIYDDPYPYRSEYPYDRTAFESSYALAKYGATTKMESDTNLWYDKNLKKWYSHPDVDKQDAFDFMKSQHAAALSARGWLETKYFLLGSDFTSSSDDHTLSYMARMGGWSILDYGLQFAENPYDWLQLGYASYLSSFALMNTGTSETNYGYWYPGKENDGALGWAFMSKKHGRAWIRKNEDRGAWRYDGEANLGMGAVVRMSATILADDPLFGWFTYGGKMEQTNKGFKIWPRDGVRIRFWLVEDDKRLGVELNRDGWSAKKPIEVTGNRDTLHFVLENRTEDDHITELTLHSNEANEWSLLFDGSRVKPDMQHGDATYNLKVSDAAHDIILTKSN